MSLELAPGEDEFIIDTEVNQEDGEKNEINTKEDCVEVPDIPIYDTVS